VFVAGADISEFGEIFKLPEEQMSAFFVVNNRNLHRLESLPFPSVVAINGFALGGGLEFCLACDYRIMSSAARIGLPETGLGLIPGWGGTVRTPRIIGLQAALEWVASGAHQKAEAALQAGMIEAVVDADSLRDVALDQLSQAIANPSEYQATRAAKTGTLAISAEEALQAAAAAKEKICARAPQLQAPAAVIDLIAAGVQLSAAEALAEEGELFVLLAKSAQARALVGNFMNDQLIKKVAKGYAKKSKLVLDKATVVGAGIMGGGIAYQNALKNIPVVMKDIAEPALELGMNEAGKLLSKLVRQGRMSEQKKTETLSKINPTLAMDDVVGSKVIVEAVVENPKVKEIVLAELEDTLAKGGVLVSNTSTITISRLAKALKHPEQFAGLHFFNPVHAMPLVEVIRGEKTSDQAIADLVAYTLALGKQPIVVNDCPAFLVNRVLFPYFRGFEQLINDGADFQQVDQVMQAWGWPMGPAYLADVVGIDTLCHCMEVLAEDFPDRMSLLEQSILGKLGAAERYGQKNGKGFFQYQADEKGRPQRSGDDATTALIAQCQSVTAEFSDADIEIRCMLPMAIEMARCLEEGIVASPAEADMALMMGLGFPAFRGGIVRWMDEMGLELLCQWSDKFAQLGEAYRATDAMREMAASGKSYY
jgi:3-hydroxyacyl-CoA dehydrogenase/enoyl-CoA hydratase/3-hydroxybutyryl-CoA epimerase/enoyl-CoA isomerase